jgi:hypothetical protein
MTRGMTVYDAYFFKYLSIPGVSSEWIEDRVIMISSLITKYYLCGVVCS